MAARELVASSGLLQSSVSSVICLQQGVVTFNGAGGNENTVACPGFSLSNCTVSFDNLSNAALLPTTVAASAVADVSFTAKGAAGQSGTAYYQVLKCNAAVPAVNAP